MDEAWVDDRLDRIDVLGRSGASHAEVLAALRELVRAPEASVVRDADGEEVVERLRTAPHGT